MASPINKIILALVLVVAAAGCKKKTETASAPPTPPDAPVVAVAVPATPAEPAKPAVVQNVGQSLTDVDAALRAKAYDKAVQTLLALQQQRGLSDQQAQEAAIRMRALQASLANAVASGDPLAKAAADRLRQASTVR